MSPSLAVPVPSRPGFSGASSPQWQVPTLCPCILGDPNRGHMSWDVTGEPCLCPHWTPGVTGLGCFCSGFFHRGPRPPTPGAACLPWAVRAWRLSLPSQNSPSRLPKPCLYAAQSRSKSTEPSSLRWKTCRAARRLQRRPGRLLQHRDPSLTQEQEVTVHRAAAGCPEHATRSHCR